MVVEIEVIDHTDTEVSTDTIDINSLTDTEVIALTNTHVIVLTDMQMIALTDTKSFIHINGGFLGGIKDHTLLIEYVDHVALRLWH